MGSGKSAVAEIIRLLGHPVLSADSVAREVVKPSTEGLQQVVSAFGPGVLATSGELDRRALGRLVFDQPEKLRVLESIVHPKIRDWVAHWRKQQESAGAQLCFYEVPLLFEKSMEDQFDQIICVTAPQEFVLQRIRSRDGLSDSEIKKRWAQQVPDFEKQKKSDFVILNDGSFEKLKGDVVKVLQQLTSPKSSQN
jgi:dephospho-CoA kinase